MSKNEESRPQRIILDVGRQKRKAIRELKEGLGAIAEEVEDAARGEQDHPPAGREIVPVVILYRKRARKPRRLLREILRRL